MPKGEWAPQVQKGNSLALRHGAYTPRKVDPLAKEIMKSVLADPDTQYVLTPAFSAALHSWARLEATCQLLREFLDEHGHVDESGKPRPAYDAYMRAESQASKARQRLGLDPLSRAQLGRDIAAQNVDLARIYEQMEEQQ